MPGERPASGDAAALHFPILPAALRSPKKTRRPKPPRSRWSRINQNIRCSDISTSLWLPMALVTTPSWLLELVCGGVYNSHAQA